MSIQVSNLVRKCDVIRRSEKSVLLAIANFANHSGKGAYPSLRRLTEAAGYAKSTIVIAIKKLIEKGFLLVKKGGPKGWRPNWYEINLAALEEVVRNKTSLFFGRPKPVDNIVDKVDISVDNPVNNPVDSENEALESGPIFGLQVVRFSDQYTSHTSHKQITNKQGAANFLREATRWNRLTRWLGMGGGSEELLSRDHILVIADALGL